MWPTYQSGKHTSYPILVQEISNTQKLKFTKRMQIYKWSLNLSSLTLSITQENQDRPIWANSCGKRIDQASKQPAVYQILQTISNAKKTEIHKEKGNKMCMRRHGRNANVKRRPNLSHLTLPITQESNDRSNWANSCDKTNRSGKQASYPSLMQESSNAQKQNYKKRMQIWKGSLTSTPPYPYPLPQKIRIHPFKLIHVAYESIKPPNTLPLTTAKDLKSPNTKLHKENANMMCIRGHGKTALTIGGEGVRSEHHIRVPECLLVVATLHMGLQLHHLDELRQWHCRHSFLPFLCLC